MAERSAPTQKQKPPLFARLWPAIVRREPKALSQLREENLAGLNGRVLEVGAGTGTNFALYPQTVEHVVALEPEPSLRELAERAAVNAPVPVTVRAGAFEDLAAAGEGGFDAVIASLVLCSVADPREALAQALRALKPGGELRFVEHVATGGARGALQRGVDVTFWPRIFGNCHAHRDTVGAIRRAGFELRAERTFSLPPVWLPNPVAPMAIGRAVKPV
jgi:SAM-dependent methyltransferase